MINALILLFIITLIELLKLRKLDFKYSIPIFTALLAVFIINKQLENKFICLAILACVGIIVYSFCLVTSYKKKLIRSMQEKAIMKYEMEKR